MAAEKKILDAEFRNGLYKSLVEAGYEKEEAKKIVGAKFFSALKENLISNLELQMKRISDNDFSKPIDAELINSGISELNKLKEILSEKKQ
jgi:hypothetical protein